jgi:hypothetical protein
MVGFSAMKRCMICDLEAAHLCHPDDPKSMKVGRLRHPKMSIEGYKLPVGYTSGDLREGILSSRRIHSTAVLLSKVCICSERYSQIGYGALDMLCRLM